MLQNNRCIPARRTQTQTNLQTVLEAVRRRLVAAVSVLLPLLTEEQGPLVQEEVSLHRLEAGQLLHARGASLVADPHAERALHQHPAQLANLPLRTTEGQRFTSDQTARLIHNLRCRSELMWFTSYPVMAI